MSDMTQAKRKQDKKRIKYIRGVMQGEVKTIKTIIADDLIERGFAIDMDREPGEEG